MKIKDLKDKRAVGHDAYVDWALILIYGIVAILIFVSLAVFVDVKSQDEIDSSTIAQQGTATSSWRKVLSKDSLSSILSSFSSRTSKDAGSGVSVRPDPSKL